MCKRRKYSRKGDGEENTEEKCQYLVQVIYQFANAESFQLFTYADMMKFL